MHATDRVKSLARVIRIIGADHFPTRSPNADHSFPNRFSTHGIKLWTANLFQLGYTLWVLLSLNRRQTAFWFRRGEAKGVEKGAHVPLSLKKLCTTLFYPIPSLPHSLNHPMFNTPLPFPQQLHRFSFQCIIFFSKKHLLHTFNQYPLYIIFLIHLLS